MRAAAELLETLAANRALLTQAPLEDRIRLLQAAGQVYCPDPIIAGFNTGQHVWGKFLKDYQPADW